MTAYCPQCGQPLNPNMARCPRCGAVLGAMPGQPGGWVPEPPSLVPTVLITLFFGLFGLIPASIASNEARRNGQDGAPYWKAFWLVLLSMVVLSLCFVILWSVGILKLFNSVSSESQSLPTYVASSTQTSYSESTSSYPTTVQTGSSFPADSSECDTQVAVNDKTSCQFALNVAQAYWASPQSSTQTVQAYSTVTGQTYTMSCSTVNALTTCAGGNQAEVFIR